MKISRYLRDYQERTGETLILSNDDAFDFARLKEASNVPPGLQFRIVSVTEHPVQFGGPPQPK